LNFLRNKEITKASYKCSMSVKDSYEVLKEFSELTRMALVN